MPYNPSLIANNIFEITSEELSKLLRFALIEEIFYLTKFNQLNTASRFGASYEPLPGESTEVYFCGTKGYAIRFQLADPYNPVYKQGLVLIASSDITFETTNYELPYSSDGNPSTGTDWDSKEYAGEGSVNGEKIRKYFSDIDPILDHEKKGEYLYKSIFYRDDLIRIICINESEIYIPENSRLAAYIISKEMKYEKSERLEELEELEDKNKLNRPEKLELMDLKEVKSKCELKNGLGIKEAIGNKIEVNEIIQWSPPKTIEGISFKDFPGGSAYEATKEGFESCYKNIAL